MHTVGLLGCRATPRGRSEHSVSYARPAQQTKRCAAQTPKQGRENAWWQPFPCVLLWLQPARAVVLHPPLRDRRCHLNGPVIPVAPLHVHCALWVPVAQGLARTDEPQGLAKVHAVGNPKAQSESLLHTCGQSYL